MKTTPLNKEIVGKIKEGKATMKPRAAVIAVASVWAVGTSLIVLVVIYLASLTIFLIDDSGVRHAPAFGTPGLLAFLLSLPWVLIALAIVFIVALEIMVKHYAFAYRQPLLYSALLIIACALVGGVAVARTSLHRWLSEGESSFAAPLYRQGYAWQEPRMIHRGTITELNEEGFIMRNRAGQGRQVVITGETRLPYGSGFETDDSIVVLGECESSTIIAAGIIRIQQKTPLPHRGRIIPRYWREPEAAGVR